MSMKHGAFVSVALAAIVTIGMIGVLPGQQARTIAAERGGQDGAPAPETRTASVTEAMLELLPEAPPAAEAPLQLAAAPGSALAGLMVQSALLSQVITCDMYQLGFAADPDTTGPTVFNVTLYGDVQDIPAGIPANVAGIEWTITDPNGNATVYETVLFDDATLTILPQDLVGLDLSLDIVGDYDVAMQVLIVHAENPDVELVCPPDGPVSVGTLTVTEAAEGEGEGEAPEPATFAVTDLIGARDGAALLPFNDWTPLFRFDMTYNPDNPPAPRALANLHFRIDGDHVVRGNSSSLVGPQESDILEFAIFRNSGPQGEPDDLLDIRLPTSFFDSRVPVVVFNGHGYPYDTPDATGAFSYGDLDYNLSFVFNPHDPTFNAAVPLDLNNPQLPFYRTHIDEVTGVPTRTRSWMTAGPAPNNSYILAFRTSSSWTSGTGISYTVLGATMLPFAPDPPADLGGEGPEANDPVTVGNFPINPDDLAPIDDYPDFPLSEDVGYTSNFGLWDVSGNNTGDFSYRPGFDRNTWNWPIRMYTPRREHFRPRWDISNTMVQALTGEFLDIRRIFSVETWVPVIAINAHGDCYTGPTEVNLIVTDVGGDPFAVPGNGGFEPTEGLEKMTTAADGGQGHAVGNDYSFNGAWMFYDNDGGSNCPDAAGNPSNCPGNGIFNPPSPTGVGVDFNDFPMRPGGILDQGTGSDFVDGTFFEWEYIPFPPGGGDPWWKIRLRFSGGGHLQSGQGCTGGLESLPDFFPPGLRGNQPQADYFVTLRPDSGFRDISGLQGDGTGLPVGADFRAFIEPRRWNPLHGGHNDGGILFSSDIPAPVGVIGQDNPARDETSITMDCSTPDNCVPVFMAPQPWWTERSLNRDNAKIQQGGIEIHDLVLTYSTNNVFAKETYINIAQNPPTPVPNTDLSVGRTLFSLWVDPPILDTLGPDVPPTLIKYGMLQSRFTPPASVGVERDVSENLTGDDALTAIQYAYETVPFDLTADAIDGQATYPRSSFYPEPAEQPTLPRFRDTRDYLAFDTSWPLNTIALAWGEESYCYLYDEGVTNEPYAIPTSPDSESTYSDDVYAFVLEDGAFSGVDTLAGKWLVDRAGNRYKITGNNGNTLFLMRGHNAYMDKFARFPDRPATLAVYPDGVLNLPDWPFGVPEGEDFAISRGRWAVTDVAKPRGTYPHATDWKAGLSPRIGGALPLHEPNFPVKPEDQGARAARLLKQHVEAESEPMAMLGINLAGTDDFIVNQNNSVSLDSITIAFWGPDFDRRDLAALDPNGTQVTSGVLLYEDSNASGVYNPPVFFDFSPVPALTDAIVPLEPGTLQWAQSPEAIDLDGDDVADDMSGDGVVFLHEVAGLTPSEIDALVQTAIANGEITGAEAARWDGLSDLAWVLRLQPRGTWNLPQSDRRTGAPISTPPGAAPPIAGASPAEKALASPFYSTAQPSLYDLASVPDSVTNTKALAAGGSEGDDLFVVVRTSGDIAAFEQFRCVVPARLPERSVPPNPVVSGHGGIQLAPFAYTVVNSYQKSNPDEGAVQDFYSHDMAQANVPTRILDLTGSLEVTPAGTPAVAPGGPPVAVLGLDLSNNRPDNLIARGSGVGTIAGVNTFEITDYETGITDPADPHGTPDGWVGLWLVGLNQVTGDTGKQAAYDLNAVDAVEAFQITGVAGNTLTLLAGAPRAGSEWYVVKDPTFLEQVIVEFYDVGRDGQFRLPVDFLELNYEDPVRGFRSGVSLYRDNDLHPLNTNGVFDPPVLDPDTGAVVEYIDLPVRLDDPPIRIGRAGEPQYQVKMVFSSPGTDNIVGRPEPVVPYETQPRLRQVIPQTFGRTISEDAYGPDFFVVVRPSLLMSQGDDFAAAIVSWGPNTPTEPDPDNFSVTLEPGDLRQQREDEFDIFSEFPWGARGIGLISFFQDPPPVYNWTYSYEAQRFVPAEEVDHSQDDRDPNIRYWVRTNPNKFARTAPITALETPTFDFEATPVRQALGEEVAFQILSNQPQNISTVTWDFGDGSTGDDRFEQSPTHVYGQTGVYSVSVTIVDRFGTEITLFKDDYIEIIETPFADFSAQPLVVTLANGVAAVSFSSAETDPGPNHAIESYFWDFGDQSTGDESSQANPTHLYTAPGFYTVTLEVTFRESGTGELVRNERVRQDYVQVILAGGAEGEGEGEIATDPANFTIESAVRDREALVPLCDWVPLLRFTMNYGVDAPAPRNLARLRYIIHGDDDSSRDLGYLNAGGPDQSDLLEFGLFREVFDGGDDANNGVLSDFDVLIARWANDGAPYGVATGNDGFISYDLNFLDDTGTPLVNITAAPDVDNTVDGASYVLAVRTSATWRSQLTMSADALFAQMVTLNGNFPLGDDGAPLDSYTPDFLTGEILENTDAYASSFSVFEMRGTPLIQDGLGMVNTWTAPHYMYTPVAEFTRPRWNAFDQLLDSFSGEFLRIRQLVPMEAWFPVLGLNIHSTKSLHFDQYDPDVGFRTIFADRPAAELREVNVIMTDIGADPLGPPGNGGFNPITGMNEITYDEYPTYEPVLEHDFSFNGVWVWSDTNNNGIFDPPTQVPGGGITFTDRPMFPGMGSSFFQDQGWEYIANPPGGGDPWWKLKMKFIFGERRPLAETEDETNVAGFLEPTPDNVFTDPISSWTFDYFLVIRTDSGYQDISMGPNTGGGITAGADFRVFIEPRRFNARFGHEDGGIYLSSMIPAQGSLAYPDFFGAPWQDYPQWGAVEPWWPQRTHNASAAKPLRSTVDVHDLTLTYESDSEYAFRADIFFGRGSRSSFGSVCYGFADGLDDPTDFDRWMDPFGLLRSQFLNLHSVGVTYWSVFGSLSIPLSAGDAGIGNGINFTYDESWQYAYETVPFLNSLDGDNRSSAYATPPFQPNMPAYATWPALLAPGEYPRASDWPLEETQARLLTQKIDVDSNQTAMLGINLAGVDDIIVNGRQEPSLAKITLAFWGPDFTPDDLAPLDPDGSDLDSGILLWEDADQNGVFFTPGPIADYADALPVFDAFDDVVPLRNLQWASSPEPIDLDGDGAPDDLNGDGVADSNDLAWVVEIEPGEVWPLPHNDNLTTGIAFNFILRWCVGANFFGGTKEAEALQKQLSTIEAEILQSGGPDEKALDPAVDQGGDDLFITVKTSDKARRFEQFRVLVPATLPSRRPEERQAGIQFFPEINTSPSAYTKTSPDEDPVQDFYGHDMMEVNVPHHILNLTNATQKLTIGGAAMAVMGVDASTNRPDATLATGDAGVGLPAGFTAVGAAWAEDEFAGDWLVDKEYHAFEIVSNTVDQLSLRFGTPAEGPWRIVRDPTFLEQLIVELYDQGANGNFNPVTDLLPLSIDPRISGLALYRDNDNDPRNRNGIFDADIDLPVELDVAPFFSGVSGESTQVKFVFSTPGTDDVPVPMAQQTNHRQWIPDSFGRRTTDPDHGAEFFLVIRASDTMEENDDFRVGIVSWGPNTPSEPDPDTWARLSGGDRDGYKQFEEFNWGSRGLGFISFFKEPPTRYFMDGNEARQRPDTSGINWVRSHSAKKQRSGVIEARKKPLSPVSVVIDGVSETALPAQTLPGEPFEFVIRGRGFGSDPEVLLSGYDVVITAATDNTIDVTISSRIDEPPVEPIILIVKNPATREETVRSDLFSLVGGSTQDGPKVIRVEPDRGTQAVFPVVVHGANFGGEGSLSVYFGDTEMQVLNVAGDGSWVNVGFPAGGISKTGPLDVTVRDESKGKEDVLVNGFEYLNSPDIPGIGCAAGSAESGAGGDLIALMAVLALLLGACRAKMRNKA